MYRVDRFEWVQHIIAVMWPFLSPVKRAQAAKALRFYLDFEAHGIQNYSPRAPMGRRSGVCETCGSRSVADHVPST